MQNVIPLNPVMNTVLQKLTAIYQRCDDYIIANFIMMKRNRSRVIDLGVVALMEFEDEIFNWDYLRLIFLERLSLYEHGSLPWYIDVDRTTDKILTVRHENGRQLQLDIGQVLLSVLKTTH